MGILFTTGAERKSAVIQEENRRLVAYHEAGHAVVALCTPGVLHVIFVYYVMLTMLLACSVLCSSYFVM